MNCVDTPLPVRRTAGCLAQSPPNYTLKPSRPGFGPAAEPPWPNSTCAASRRLQIGVFQMRQPACRCSRSRAALAAQLSVRAVRPTTKALLVAHGPESVFRAVPRDVRSGIVRRSRCGHPDACSPVIDGTSRAQRGNAPGSAAR